MLVVYNWKLRSYSVIKLLLRCFYKKFIKLKIIHYAPTLCDFLSKAVDFIVYLIYVKDIWKTKFLLRIDIYTVVYRLGGNTGLTTPKSTPLIFFNYRNTKRKPFSDMNYLKKCISLSQLIRMLLIKMTFFFRTPSISQTVSIFPTLDSLSQNVCIETHLVHTHTCTFYR